MATYTVARSKHATLGVSTVDTVTLTTDYVTVEVLNRDASADIYFTVNGATPAVGADDTYICRAGQGLPVEIGTQGNTVVKLISASAAAYTVTGISGGA